MKVKREELLDALKVVKNAVADKEILEQSDSFIFNGGQVHAFNDEIAITTDCPVDFTGAVKAKELLAFLNKCRDEFIEITKKKNEVQLKGKRIKAGLILASEIMLPLDEISEPGKWSDLPSTFETALNLCAPSCSQDMHKPALTCVHLSGNKAEACDSERLTIYEFSEEYFKKELLLPYYAANLLTQIPVQLYSVNKGWVHFAHETEEKKLMVSCRVFNTSYPDLSQYIKIEGATVKFPPDLPDILERAQIFAATDVKHRHFTDILIKPGKCIVSAKNDNGWVRESIKLKYKGDPIKFRINPITLREILKLLNKVTIGDTSMKFTGKNFVHSVSLISAEE